MHLRRSLAEGAMPDLGGCTSSLSGGSIGWMGSVVGSPRQSIADEGELHARD